MISVILPTVRPDKANECIEAIIGAAEGCDQIEIVVVSDFQLFDKVYIDDRKCAKMGFRGGQNLHIRPILRQRLGVVDANNVGYASANGDYIMTLSDEALLQPFALWELEHFVKTYKNKVLTSPRHIPFYNFKYYDKWFAPFPFAHRSLIDDLGGLFLRDYKCFYADPDLSLRAYVAGYPVVECHDAVIVHKNEMNDEAHKHNVSAYVEADREVFKKKWAHLGEFVDP